MPMGAPGGKRECPMCKRPLKKKDTWRGIIYAVVCFPCGIYFCLRRRQLRCKACKYEVFFTDTQSVPTTAASFKCYRDMRWQLFRPFTLNPTAPVIGGNMVVPSAVKTPTSPTYSGPSVSKSNGKLEIVPANGNCVRKDG